MSRAFTLIESVIVVALFIVVMLGVMQLYIVFGRVITGQSASIGAVLDGSDIVDAARSAGLQARAVVAAHTFSGVSYSSGTTTIIFELPSVDSSGAPIPGAFDYIGIYASSTEAYRVIDAAQGSARVSGEKLLTSILGALNFTYDATSFPSVTSVTVDATTSAVVRGQAAYTHLHERVYLRNL